MKDKNFKVIGFDADDTLWVNETYYRETEEAFCSLMSDYCSAEEASSALYRTEVKNLGLYGYGAKGYILSMIEAGFSASEGRVSPVIVRDILNLGKEQISRPMILLEGVEDTLKILKEEEFRLIVATKGDLLDQERKLEKSGIAGYFHHIEIMSDKKSSNYRKLLSHLEIKADEFLMVGNSLKSDIYPVLELGGSALHIPYHTTWQHEESEPLPEGTHFREIQNISAIPDILKKWNNL